NVTPIPRSAAAATKRAGSSTSPNASSNARSASSKRLAGTGSPAPTGIWLRSSARPAFRAARSSRAHLRHLAGRGTDESRSSAEPHPRRRRARRSRPPSRHWRDARSPPDRAEKEIAQTAQGGCRPISAAPRATQRRRLPSALAPRDATSDHPVDWKTLIAGRAPPLIVRQANSVMIYVVVEAVEPVGPRIEERDPHCLAVAVGRPLPHAAAPRAPRCG